MVELIEQLLHEEESSALDFKRDQYPFSGASDLEKAELLKDILAFANAWRRTNAYILIGVQDVQGGRSQVVGVSSHLNDADLQQFVNSKTQRPVEFTYRAATVEGRPVGVVEVPVQARPYYLTRDFGRLKKGVVYLRRGSSTAEATPDEIAQMGAAAVVGYAAGPALELELGDPQEELPHGLTLNLRCVHLHPLLSPSEVPWSRPSSHGGLLYDSKYPAKLINYVRDVFLFDRFGIVVHNRSGTVAEGVRLVATTPKAEGLAVWDPDDYPARPQPSYAMNIQPAMHSIMAGARSTPKPRVREFSGHWELTVEYGKILPKTSLWTVGAVHIGSTVSRDVTFAAQIFGENVPDPISVGFSIGIDTETRPMTEKDVRPLVSRY